MAQEKESSILILLYCNSAPLYWRADWWNTMSFVMYKMPEDRMMTKIVHYPTLNIVQCHCHNKCSLKIHLKGSKWWSAISHNLEWMWYAFVLLTHIRITLIFKWLELTNHLSNRNPDKNRCNHQIFKIPIKKWDQWQKCGRIQLQHSSSGQLLKSFTDNLQTTEQK